MRRSVPVGEVTSVPDGNLDRLRPPGDESVVVVSRGAPDHFNARDGGMGNKMVIGTSYF
ncbi:hypothetical protein EXIGUO8H_310002 [Exiguobacterium sp. 8H]|uniref:hypothetical protein n=1 Tax=unclassified Exiguobacterium TaxID=2644629 RepID=UPI0012F259E7|nr:MULTISPECIES: hypothetical protein [unclassified Exiguobacterium]VXB82418.1 hypothetical protein EXIGUO8H_310002 [Exiguobacterium sp. 8H]VXB92564.1 hypothetical protein EXIGUO8A_250011 [Exiguobacterium sp. 8A]